MVFDGRKSLSAAAFLLLLAGHDARDSFGAGGRLFSDDCFWPAISLMKWFDILGKPWTWMSIASDPIGLKNSPISLVKSGQKLPSENSRSPCAERIPGSMPRQQQKERSPSTPSPHTQPKEPPMNTHTPLFKTILFFIPLSLIIFFTGCSKTPDPLSKTGFYFDTVITITLYDKPDESILDGCFSLAETYENRLSKTKENSDVWNINHSGGKPTAVSEDTLALLRACLFYAELSDGKADPTIGPITELWDFSGSSPAVLPAQTDLENALNHVGYEGISIEGDMVRLADPDAEIDLGFIAKGYIADRMKEYLASQGVASATINLGGNVLAIGSRPDGSPFRIGIQKPFCSQRRHRPGIACFRSFRGLFRHV